MTWEPNKVLTSKWAVGEYTRGAVARIVDIDDLAKRPVHTWKIIYQRRNVG